jgi:predicted MPP superfamily phosphohydrolase
MELRSNKRREYRFRIESIAILLLLLILLSSLGCQSVPAETSLVTFTPAPFTISIADGSATNPPNISPPLPPPPPPTPIPTPEEFSIVWLADTQTIAYHQQNDVFQAMGEWIMSNEKPLDIRYIVQTGDMVDNGFQKKQWDSFHILLDQFYGKIPYLPIAGNHDIGVKWENYRGYLDQSFVKELPKDHIFNRGRAVYAEFQAGGVDFLLIGAGWNSEVLSSYWVNKTLKAHPDHVAILLFHSYTRVDGGLSRQGVFVHDMIVKNNPNVRLVLSGHLRGNGFRAEEFDDNNDGVMDRTVNAMLYNYQGYDHTNSGQIRVLTFDTATRNIHVFTYSPYTERYFRDEYFKSNEFDLENAF